MSTVRWARTDQCDGAHEILTLVRRDAVGDVVVQVTTGADDGDDFVGLYDLDGDQIQLGTETWTVVGEDEISPETIAEVEGNWECGSSVVTRLSDEVAS